MAVIYAATGHRPDKLGGYGVATSARLQRLAEWYLGHHRPDGVISGMALGWDQAWASAAVALGIPFIAALPFAGQDSKWPAFSRHAYAELLDRAHEVVTVSPGGYSSAAMMARNRWVVDNCSGVIALWDGSSGGTGNCVAYAESVRRPMVNLWPYLEQFA